MEMCFGKIVYDKRGALTVRNQRRKDGAKTLRVYHCPKCNGWHLTHKEE